MVDHTTGSFGSYNPLGNSFSNIGGMYMLGGNSMNQSNTPGVASMYGSSSQMFFNPYVATPVSYGYQAPIQAMHSYGVEHSLKYGLLGMPMPLGMNNIDNQLSRREYRHLAGVGLAADIGGIGAGAALGAAAVGLNSMAGAAGVGAVAGTALSIGAGIAGGAALAVPMLIGAAADSHVEAYKRTQQVGSMFSNIARSGGSVGLSGRESARIAKFVDRLSSNDLLLDADDYMNTMSMAKDSGMLNGITDVGQIERKFKELSKALKTTADIMGSSDLKEVMNQITKFSMLGFSTANVSGTIGSLMMSGKFAGMSQAATMDSFNADVMAGQSIGLDARRVYQDSIRSNYEMKLLQQGGLLSPMMNNPRTYKAADREVRTFSAQLAKSTTGMSRYMEDYYVSYLHRQGYSNEEAARTLEGLSEQEKLDKIVGYSSTAGYQKGIIDQNFGMSIIRQNRGLEKIKTKDDFTRNFKRYKKIQEERGGPMTGQEIVALMVPDIGQLSPEAYENMVAKADYMLKYGEDALKRAMEVGERMAKRREIFSVAGREQEKTGAYGTIVRFGKRMSQRFKEAMHGYESAGEMQDVAKSMYGNYSLGSPANSGEIHFDTGELSRKEKMRLALNLANADIDISGIEKNKVKIKDFRSIDSLKGGNPEEFMSKGFFMDSISLSSDRFNNKYADMNGNTSAVVRAGRGLSLAGAGLATGAAIGMLTPPGLVAGALVGTALALFGGETKGFDLFGANKDFDEKKKLKQDVYKGATRKIGYGKIAGKPVDDRLMAIMGAKELSKGNKFSYEANLEFTSFMQGGGTYEEWDKLSQNKVQAGIIEAGETTDHIKLGDAYKVDSKFSAIKGKLYEKIQGMSTKEKNAYLSADRREKKEKISDIINKAYRHKTGAKGDTLIKHLSEEDRAYIGAAVASDESIAGSVYDNLSPKVRSEASEVFMASMIGVEKPEKLGVSKETTSKTKNVLSKLMTGGVKFKDAMSIIEKGLSGKDSDFEEMRKKLKSMKFGESDSILSELSEISGDLNEKTKIDGTDKFATRDDKAASLKKSLIEGAQKSKDKLFKNLKQTFGLKSEDDVKEILNIAQTEDSTERSRKFLAAQSKYKGLQGMTSDAFMSKALSSSIFSKDMSAQDLADSGANEDQVRLKMYDKVSQIYELLDKDAK